MSEHPRHRWALVAGLLLLAPTVGEFLLGNIPVSQYASVLVLVPLYGAGALLVREAARRLGGGWPTIALFAAAYALVEEGPVDQMVFNPGYLDLPSFAGYGDVPGLHVSLTLVVWSLALHTIWSICVPIALVEAFDPEPTRPWLGRTGLVVTAAVFVAGCVFLAVVQAQDLDFVGTPTQFVASTVAIMALVAAGVAVRSRHAAADPRPAPPPWVAGVLASALTSAYWMISDPPFDAALRVTVATGGFVVAAVVGVLLVRRWSRRRGWDGRHRLALAIGAGCTYALWFGPSQAHEAGTGMTETVVGALVFGGGFVLLAVLAARRQMRRVIPRDRASERRSAPRWQGDAKAYWASVEHRQRRQGGC